MNISNTDLTYDGNLAPVHPELVATDALVYQPCQFKISLLTKEAESAEYGAYKFELNGLSIIFRVAKITPTKLGQFVTCWKRESRSPIQPFDASDSIDFLVVVVRKDKHFGQFVFPKSVLLQMDIFSKEGKGGKRAIRVYPPWDKTLNKQAQKTQMWQVNYFLEIPENGKLDYSRCQGLYGF